MKAILIFLIGLPVFYIVTVILYGTFTRYKPEKIEYPDRVNPKPPFMISDSSFSITTWNIGFGGLGAESDFFYDGGKMVRTSKNNFNKNMAGILTSCEEFDTDFICLQEVDTFSKRSFFENQVEKISGVLSDYEYIYSENYHVKFVPLPLLKPLGKVNSGIMNLSKLPTTYQERHDYGSQGKWPNSLFMLTRCFQKMHVPLSSGKDLVIINIHNSAYDPDGSMKKTELNVLMPYIYGLYDDGNHVVVAGDWNQCTPDYKTKGKEKLHREFKFSANFLQTGWKWAADDDGVTNRKLNLPYDSQNSYTSNIDYFLVSPNVKIEKVKIIDQKFEYSDHHPVQMFFSLK